MATRRTNKTPAAVIAAVRQLLLVHRPAARPEELAEWIFLRNERTVRRWISGESPVPEEAKAYAFAVLESPAGARALMLAYDSRVRLAKRAAQRQVGRMPVTTGGRRAV